MKSIRARLMLLLTLGLGGLCAVGGLASFRAVRGAALREFDYALQARAGDLATLVRREHGLERLARLSEFNRTDHPEFYQIISAGRAVTARSASLGEAELQFPAERGVVGIELLNGLSVRAIAVSLSTSHGEHGEHERNEGAQSVLVLARDTTRLDESIVWTGIGFFAGGLLLVLLAATLVLLVVKRGLKPLDALADRAAGIDPQALDTRFEEVGLPDELRPITQQLNATLARIQTAFDREKYLTGAMAHELYTPIAEARSMAEVALKWPDDAEATGSLAENMQEVATRMQRIVDALLSLSRCEAGLQRVETEPVDLAALLAGIECSFAPRFAEKEISIVRRVAEGASIETDLAMAAVLLTNLFKNAADYTPQSGRFSYLVEQQDEGVSLIFTNTNANLMPDDLARLAEPFWRKDNARTGDSHSGLGLAVVARFGALLDVAWSVDLPQPDQFQVTLTFPA